MFSINEIKNLIDKNLIGDGLIIDYPSGIGNLFIYLQKIINKNTSIIKRTCKFLALNDTNPWLIKVRKVIIPREMQRIDEIIIQFRPLIILNILNNS